LAPLRSARGFESFSASERASKNRLCALSDPIGAASQRERLRILLSL
jgi:hypothetical protein